INREFDKAIADFSSAIGLKPDWALVYLLRGVCRSRQGDLLGAIADYTEAIVKNPQLAAAYAERSVALRQSGNAVEADDDLAQARSIKSDIFEEYWESGGITLGFGDLLGAVTDFERALELEPNHPQAQVLRDKIAELQQILSETQ